MTFEEALKIALEAHWGQIDKAGQPYILHPLHLASTMETDDERIIAILHDVLEDAPSYRDVLVGRLPLHLWEALVAITRKDKENYSDYIDRCRQNKMAIKIKKADLIHNLTRLHLIGDEKTAERLHKKYLNALYRIEDFEQCGCDHSVDGCDSSSEED